MLNSYARGSAQQNRNFNDNTNAISILPPEITSTPLNSPNRARVAIPLVTPTRKFFGPRRYALSSNGTLSPQKTIKDPPGPLLTSASYNVNISTYIDTKSPGYTGRLVQYNEENPRNQQHTHQEKYGSPGLFPIVHLFKKDIPVISPKPKKATVRIGTPELKSQYSQEHNRLLLEGIVRSNSVIKEHNHSNEVSTRSVLDALKEISRKRIHASEEYELIDEKNKKLRRDSVNDDGDSSKRNRVDSPISDTSASPPARQAMKKLCTIDAVLASKTSSMYANYDTGTKRKTIEDVKTKISPVNKKKFTHAETQTIGSSVPTDERKTLPEPTNEESKEMKKEEKTVDHSSVHAEEASPPKQVLKVFDDKPLEIIRKNRLGALLSALTGHEIPPIPMEDRRKALDQDWPPQGLEKKLVSILSPQNKQAKSVEKHVTFNLPDNSNSTQLSSSVNLSANQSISLDKTSEEVKHDSISKSKTFESSGTSSNSDNQTTSLDVTPISADKSNNGDISNAPSGSFKSDSSKLLNSASLPSTPVGGFKFDLTKPVATSAKDSIDKNKVIDVPSVSKTSELKVESSKSNFTSLSVANPPPTTSPSTFTASLPKSNNSSPILSSMKTNIFAKISPTNSLGLPTSLPQAGTTQSFMGVSSSAPSFGTTQSTSITNAPKNVEKATPVFIFNSNESAKSSSGFGGPLNSSVSVESTVPNFGKTVGSAVASFSTTSFTASRTVSSALPPYSSIGNSPTLAFGTTTTNSSFSTPSSTTTVLGSTTGSFGISSPVPSAFQASTTSPSFNNTASKSNLTATSLPSFGGSMSSATTSAPTFGTTASSSNGFNFGGANSLPAFGSSVVTGPVSTSSVAPSKSFGSSSFGTSQSNVSFGNTKVTTSSFGTGSLTTSSLGTTVTPNPMFGTTTTPSFGANPPASNNFKTDSKPFTFGSGSNQTFGNPSTSANTSSIFSLKNSQSGMTLGTNTTASSASNVQFGSTAPTFGAAGSNMFSAPSGSNFGQSTTASPFGSTNAPNFGAVTTSSTFGSTGSLSFGAPNTTTPAFGVTGPTNFGAPSTTTSMFGTTNTPTFGTTNTPTFGSTNTPTFGTTNTTAPGFGTTNTLSFGASSTTAPAFGTNTLTFGAPTTSTVFGTTSTPSFGNPTTASGFGTTNTPSFGSGTFNTPSFGASSAPFGTAATSSANTFNSNNATSPFGNSTGTSSFGNFGSTGSPFNAVTTASSFGTNMNNTFGSSNATSTFGSSNAITFGGSNATSSPFGGAQSSNTFGNNASGPNTFGSGFGATSAKAEQSSNIFPAPANNVFGSNPTFGSSQNNNVGAAPAGGVFTFGSPNAQPSSSTGVFAFGATEPPKTFNFSAPGTSGSVAASNGGFPATPSFGQASGAMPSMFSIGSGASTTQNRSSRPLARAKRRT